MWWPLVLLAIPSVIAGYSYGGAGPLLERLLHAGAPAGLAPVPHAVHSQAGTVALLAVAVGILVAAALYYFRWLEPAKVAEQFAPVFTFLKNKWYFDELYDVVFVQPALAIARRCRRFDWVVIDGVVDGTASLTVEASFADGRFDYNVIDGAANLISDVVYNTGDRLRFWQTGRIRQYLMFLAVGAAAIGAFFSLTWPQVVRILLGCQ